MERIAAQLRVFKRLHETVWESMELKNSSVAPLQESEAALYQKVEQHLFPWIKPGFESTQAMRASVKGNGIVICIGNHLTKMALATIQMVRQVHRSNIPFEVFYIGDDDLSEANRQLLEAVPFTTTRNIRHVFNDDQLKLAGWAIKTFAIMASSFENAILIDADVVFLQNPETLFASHLFHRHGALFFSDRSLFSHGAPAMNWMRSVIPTPMPERTSNLRVFQGKTAHEQESGVVVINKRTNFVGLMAACYYNVGNLRELVYEYVMGDKETFWIGFETVQEDYSFNLQLPGTLGVPEKSLLRSPAKICARQILHLDEHGVPLWINGGITESKYEEASAVITAQSYVVEPAAWELAENNLACIKTDRAPLPISALQRDIIRESGEIFVTIRDS
ncbi:hypothetical protein HDV03_005213 [Kappamyces sp. JEL0829]|nr:hypothetical protein HDV03_005213 [Kappamyces sp. JEL0829]